MSHASLDWPGRECSSALYLALRMSPRVAPALPRRLASLGNARAARGEGRGGGAGAQHKTQGAAVFCIFFI
jgi:hypothetical protein